MQQIKLTVTTIGEEILAEVMVQVPTTPTPQQLNDALRQYLNENGAFSIVDAKSN